MNSNKTYSILIVDDEVANAVNNIIVLVLEVVLFFNETLRKLIPILH